MIRYTCLINYFGGKSKLAQHYPKPRHDTVIEPFAGGAAYALRYAEREVILNDLDDRVVAIWRAVIDGPLDPILRAIPDTVKEGDRVSQFLTSETPKAAELIMRACCNVGAFGDTDTRDKISPFARKQWHSIKPRLEYWAPRVRHWRVVQADYSQLPNWRATWFVDPPYSNGSPGLKGMDYAHGNSLDYGVLAAWCRTRRGAVIACDQADATWLPFRPLAMLHATSKKGPYRVMEGVALTGLGGESRVPRTPVHA